MSDKSIPRRDFLKQAAIGTAAFMVYPPSRVLGANDRVRVGMIGVGGRGQELLKQVLAVPNAELVAIADIYTRRHAEAKAMAPNIRTYNDHRQLLDQKDIDAVIVASPLHIHEHHFVNTLNAGKDLYSEKTMTWSIPEAEQCVSAAKDHPDRVIQIGLQHVSDGSLADAKQWLKDGAVGKVTMVQSWMSRNTRHGHGQWVRPIPSDCTPANLNWSAFLNGRPDRPFDPNRFINWRLFWEFSGGNLTENMVHQMSWIMTALDLPIPTAAVMSGGVFSEKDGREVPDTISVTLEFPQDMILNWQSTFSNSHYGLGEHILGSDGTIEHVAGEQDMVSGKSKDTTRYFPEKLNRPGGEAAVGNTPDQNHMANFIDCVRSRKQPNASVDIGYRSAIAAHMANLAYRSKQRVTWEQAKSMTPDVT
ncbi:MAG: Gfo/Idh/MocA family protein [Terriglobales bacterium]